jgi:curved DNA-binding protein
MNNSLYNVLEVQETASPEDIKKAYRKLSMTYHPDKNKNSQESTEKIQKINEAYEILGDPDKRREYDMTKNNPFLKNDVRTVWYAAWNASWNEYSR